MQMLRVKGRCEDCGVWVYEDHPVGIPPSSVTCKQCGGRVFALSVYVVEPRNAADRDCE